MAAVQPRNRSSSMERGLIQTTTSAVYSRNGPARASTVLSNGTVLKNEIENRAPSASPAPGLPKSLGGMLKTGTETGEIGIFSIRPPRVRPNLSNSPRRISASGGSYSNLSQDSRKYQVYGGSGVDDRRRLPSYSRDASSEVISMYETASQKSPHRYYNDPDYRSYSMTQPYSHHALSNHRSYSSLRSQPEGTVQRPISPFAYPARLRRPGFRPSSPALTDGGGVDYARRAEIERVHHGPRSSSPSSLYAHRRRPPPLRMNANRSNPSLLSQSSPPRRSPSPFMQQDVGTPRSDWQRRNGHHHPASMNSSPARSTLSFSSTVNLYQTVPVPSTTTTPGKVPPSPLYYDYTEDFEVEEYESPQTVDPPPQFRVEKTIPEDRPISSHWQQAMGNGDAFDSKRQYVAGPRSSSLPLPKRSRASQTPSPGKDLAFGTEQQTIPSVSVSTNDKLGVDDVDVLRDKKIIRLSRLGVGAQQLSSHVEEAFGLPSSPSFELIIPDEQVKMTQRQVPDPNREVGEWGNELEDGMESQSIRTSTYSFNTHLKRFPPPPEAEADVRSGDVKSQRVSGERDMRPNRLVVKQPPSPSRSKTIGHDGTTEDDIERNPSLRAGTKRSSIIAGMDPLDITELISTLEESNRRKAKNNQSARETTNQVPATPAKERIPLSLFSLRHAGKENLPKLVPAQQTQLAHRPSKKRRVEAATEPIYGEKDVPNFSHQIPRRGMSRSDSPMIAPKPISPARQLKLKNSIPQLMKALPPVPPDTPVRVVSPPLELVSTEIQLPCKFSPLMTEARSSTMPVARESIFLCQIPELKVAMQPGTIEPDSLLVEAPPLLPDEENALPPLQPPKLRLKMKNPGAPPPSPLTSRPWNLEESYPWSSQVSIGLRPGNPEAKPESIKQPKFKLKITRASESTLGTVRINRESGESRSGLNLRNPKDLFTPYTEIDNVFQKVGKHLHLRKGSSHSIRYSIDKKKCPALPTPDQAAVAQSHGTNLNTATSSPLDTSSAFCAAQASPTEVRSFFSENSSNANDRGSLRKRLSKFRAKVISPYITKIGAHSHDDITWRGRTDGLTPKPARSHPDLQATRWSTEAPRPAHGHVRRITEKIKNHHLREKVSDWFREARTVIKACVKPKCVPA